MSILTLGIESSCDETSAAVVADGRVVLSDVIASSLEFHKLYGGVVPEIASRKHLEVIDSVIDRALKEADVTAGDIDIVGVTRGPGLIGALLVGVAAAKTLAYAWDKPLVPVHHLEGHISANFLEAPELEPPFVCLVVSGGHSHIVRVEDYGKFRILGRTRDDAAGEAFDKIARALGLGYPGGPEIDRQAKNGDPHAIKFPETRFPDSFDFSFSGIKTAVLNYLNNTKAKGGEIVIPDVCASFQQAVVDVLSGNLIAAARSLGERKVVLAGGVAANSALKAAVNAKASKAGMKVYYPRPLLCTDNGAMIASAAHYAWLGGRESGADMNAVANWDLEEL
ncbi:MAG: tRNA (adenosine(37)-N6)-threonylcarbamoyltransferase complex transferase subunit TsaD [Clostridia bacterium]|nr:tRNA (adenosine(37)-N6)-threonylcarbamoyltransferase complex transferase subunit TsaD [Clostridia bacterium]